MAVRFSKQSIWINCMLIGEKKKRREDIVFLLFSILHRRISVNQLYNNESMILEILYC